MVSTVRRWTAAFQPTGDVIALAQPGNQASANHETIASEASRGIAELEDFLAAQPVHREALALV